MTQKAAAGFPVYAMLAAIVRCTAGYVLACAVSGIIQVAFVLPPLELAGAGSDRQMAAGIWATLAAVHTGLFAAPFALVAMVIAEWRGFRDLTYYLATGSGIALLGFLAQLLGGGFEQPVMVTLYVLAACLTAGVGAGLVFWLAAGRRAGKRR